MIYIFLPNNINYSSKHRLQLINAFYYHRIFSIVLKGPQGLGVGPGEGVGGGDLKFSSKIHKLLF